MEKFRKEVMGARLIEVEGYIQTSPEKVVHFVAQRLMDRTCELQRLSNDLIPHKSVLGPLTAAIEPLDNDRRSHPNNPGQRVRHPRNVRILPRSRDFH
jgi:error-prone DNA polymerase